MYDKVVLITGGAGFIGSHVVRRFVNLYPNYFVINLDCLTYAGNLENLRDIEGKPNYLFEKADIEDQATIDKIFKKHRVTNVIHLAAESHVDRSIHDPLLFLKTNILGTFNLLHAAKMNWKDFDNHTFFHISTDEVYGSLGETGLFKETTPYDPRSPYSASKASSDHLVRAYYHTYDLPILISNCSNNYGPFQFPEKLIPLFINNIKHEKPLPVYGDGKYTRDWLWVEDHASAIDCIFHKGKIGETYNIGGHNEWKNIDIIHLLCNEMDIALNRKPGRSKSLITFVTDRPGHDRRYAIDASKIKNELGWQPTIQMEEGLRLTIKWYLENEVWLNHVTSGVYRDYYDLHYTNRLT